MLRNLPSLDNSTDSLDNIEILSTDLCLYTGIKKFESLQSAFEIFIDGLKQLVFEDLKIVKENFEK
ncbi:13915_t:CDS:2 [Racocetra fulgida]|uniref:13915_t:CDS:1 n=1 Tax=Racocetra fulgida TaxID=60492 RepID=A0A9N9BKW4_9GLOM|nr:13915_t:CDS:2 [Racocetra fulgida]